MFPSTLASSQPKHANSSFSVPRGLIIQEPRNQSVSMKGFEWLAIYVIILIDIEVPIMRTEHGVGKERYHDMYQVSGRSMDIFA